MRRPAVLVALSLVTAIACEDPPSDPELLVAAWVGDEPVYVSDVQRYFESNLVGTGSGDDLPTDTMNEVKSRLFDTLIEERILYLEAARRDVRVSDLEVATYLDMGAAESPDEVDRRAWREIEARQRLMVQKLQEQVVLEQPPLSDDEIEAYAVAHRETLMPARPLELRALQLDSLEEAERIHREIRRKRMTFNEAALANESSPGQTSPLRLSWDSLSEDVRQALRDLDPGQVSNPIDVHGSVYLFQISSWLEDPSDQDVELMHRARQQLESKQHRVALDRLLAELRLRSPVRLKTADLPFRYVPPSDAG